MNSDNPNIKYVLIGLGGLVVLIGLVAVMMQRQNSASSATIPTTLSLPGSTPTRASGYRGAELMPAPPGSAGSVAGGGLASPPPAPATATGYQNSNLMPAPSAVR